MQRHNNCNMSIAYTYTVGSTVLNTMLTPTIRPSNQQSGRWSKHVTPQPPSYPVCNHRLGCLRCLTSARAENVGAECSCVTWRGRLGLDTLNQTARRSACHTRYCTTDAGHNVSSRWISIIYVISNRPAHPDVSLLTFMTDHRTNFSRHL